MPEITSIWKGVCGIEFHTIKLTVLLPLPKTDGSFARWHMNEPVFRGTSIPSEPHLGESLIFRSGATREQRHMRRNVRRNYTVTCAGRNGIVFYECNNMEKYLDEYQSLLISQHNNRRK